MFTQAVVMDYKTPLQKQSAEALLRFVGNIKFNFVLNCPKEGLGSCAEVVDVFISGKTFRSVSLFKQLPPAIILMTVRVTEGKMSHECSLRAGSSH